MEKEGVALHKGALKIDALIRMVIRRLQALSDKKNLKIDLDIEPDLPDLIIDQYRIEQVLLNVIHNAIKFTHTGGSISVRVKKLESELLFAVSDTGIGIPLMSCRVF
jgi:two-component system phosphate regulon sensor histidine kinase PhoR